MTGYDIVKKAMELKDDKYWYGAKHQTATKILALNLKHDNPGVWTDAYYNKALKDVSAGAMVCDCSGLVCYAYGIPHIGSAQIKEKFKEYSGKPRPGMIAWKQGHVGIIKTCSGKVIEMRGIDYDFQDTRYRKTAGLMTLLYDPSIEY